MEQIYQDRDQFAKLVRDVAAPDVGRMGIEILSFTIKVGGEKLMFHLFKISPGQFKTYFLKHSLYDWSKGEEMRSFSLFDGSRTSFMPH